MVQEIDQTITATKTRVKAGVYVASAVVIAGLAFAFFALNNNQENAQPEPSNVEINGQKIFVDIAQTPEEQAQGLSGRESLGENQGMLFVYDKNISPKFWMKNMNFSIDIIWISGGIVYGFEKNLPPEGENPQKIYQPKTFVNQVLEVNAGFVDKYDIKTGDKIEVHLTK